MSDLDPIARRIARHLPRDPPVSDKIAQRLAAAREIAVRRNRKRRRMRVLRTIVLGCLAVLGLSLVLRTTLDWF